MRFLPSRSVHFHLSTGRRHRMVVGVLAALLIGGACLVGLLARRENARSPVEEARTRVVLPRVAFLGPADAAVRHLILADPNTGTQTALTDAPHGVEAFAPAPDGSQIVTVQPNDDGSIDLWLVDVTSGQSHPITRCVAALCTAPTWSPDGSQIAYQRQEIGYGEDTARLWIVELATLQPALFFDDVQITGLAPTWSPDGSRLAAYDPTARAIRVRHLPTQTDTLVASDVNVSGTFAPDGARLVYPVLVRGAMGQEFYTHLEMADFTTRTVVHLSGERDEAIDDTFAAWSPDGAQLVIARRYLDERFTRGRQLYVLEVASGAVEPLVVDPAYTHAAPQWDASGRFVVYQRFSLVDVPAQPEIWVIDTRTGTRQLVAENALLPAWVE